MDRGAKLHQDLYNKYVKAHGSKSKAKCQSEVNRIWKNDIKVGKTIDEEKYVNVIAELDEKITQLEKGNIKSFFKKKSVNNNVAPAPKVNEEIAEAEVVVDELQEVVNEEGEDLELVHAEEDKAPPSTPAQDKLKALLVAKDRALNGLYEARDVGLEGETAAVIAVKIKETKVEITKLNHQLKRKVKVAMSNRAYRDRRKALEDKLKVEHPEFAAALKLRQGVGHPRI